MTESLSGRVLHFMFHRGRLEAEDAWMAEEDGAAPEDEIPDPNIRAEENAEYVRNVS